MRSGARGLVIVLAVTWGGGAVAADMTWTSESRVGTVRAAGVARGPLFDDPPAVRVDGRIKRAVQESDGQLRPPFEQDDGPPRASAVPPTDVRVDRGADAFWVFDDASYQPSGGNISNVAEPSTASIGNARFETFNWFASRSLDNGQTRQYINPYTLFPESPAAFSAGFCCDQRAVQARGLVFWYLQYIKTGSGAGDTNGVRLAMARNATELAVNAWSYWDFTPANFGLSGVWLDFPHLQASANHLYFTSNIFRTTNDTFYGSVIVRIPLAELAQSGGISYRYLVSQTYGSVMPVNGAAAEGTRPGRTTMYFGSVSGSNAINIISWPESSTQLTTTARTGLASTASGSFTCTAPDGTNPCARASARMQGGWLNANELGFSWNSNAVGSRPYPFTRVAIFSPSSLALVSQPDIWNAGFAWLYPAFSVNQRGHVGATIDLLGGTTHAQLGAIIRDDFSPATGWEIYSIVSSTNGANQWGDYNASAAHQGYPNTWVGVGRYRNASGPVINSFWFGREREAFPSVAVNVTGPGTVTSTPSGIQCGTTCNATYFIGTSVRLNAVANPGAQFLGWGGACAGQTFVQCVLPPLADPVSASARFGTDALFRHGFED